MNQSTRGQRIALEFTDDPYTELRPGDEGTINFEDDLGHVAICWDSGSHLSMVVRDNDTFPRQPGEELDRIRHIEGESKFCDNCATIEAPA